MNQSFIPEEPKRFAAALQRFDQENSQDPNILVENAQPMARELVYSRWLTEWVLRLEPNASEALRLAARSAHLRRWSIARDSYPATRAGYLRWRADLKKYHADTVGNILREVGYPGDLINKVQSLISKSAFPHEPESRTLEDALCLVFLERQFAELARKSTDDKVINALQKTWQKMTERARGIALQLPYSENEQLLLKRALTPQATSEQK